MTRIKIFEGISLQRLTIAVNHFMKKLFVRDVKTSHYLLSTGIIHVITIMYEEAEEEEDVKTPKTEMVLEGEVKA